MKAAIPGLRGFIERMEKPSVTVEREYCISGGKMSPHILACIALEGKYSFFLFFALEGLIHQEFMCWRADQVLVGISFPRTTGRNFVRGLARALAR